jgi:hypothetical protein
MLSESIFKENKSNLIEISDFTREDFLIFLLYLYSDELIINYDRSLELLKPIDIYSVFNLRSKIENVLAKSIEIENVAKIFKYSSFYNHERLKKISLAYITDNYKHVIDTQEFEELPREFMLEIIRFCKLK